MRGRYRPWQVAMVIMSTTCALLPCRRGLTDQQATTSVKSTGKRPNIVLIMADDMGYGDVHTLNSDSRIPTPNLDRLAAEGMTFTDAHTPSSVCTPTRYGLLTGRYCWRSRLKRGVQNGYGPQLIENDRPTVASFLKSNGYRTGIVGKWHLGLNFVTKDGKPAGDSNIDFSKRLTHGPNDLGFENSLVIPASLDFPPYVYIRNQKVTAVPDRTQPGIKFPGFLRKGPIGADFNMKNCLDRLADEASGFIRESAGKDKPFFLYFPLTAPHKPVLPHPRFVGKTKLGPYGDFVTQVDSIVGVVLKSIDAAGIRDNTLVVYTSDNGSFMYRRDEADAEDHVDDDTIQAFRADRHRANGVFRGTKADIWEAGHHVPFFVRWPGNVEAGSRCDDVICLTDFFDTAASIVDKPLPECAAPDSFSFAAQLVGNPAARKRPPVIHHSSGGMFAARDGKWKLVLGNGSGGRQMPRGKPFGRPYQLFDLTADIAETATRLNQHTETAKQLEAATERIRNSENYR